MVHEVNRASYVVHSSHGINTILVDVQGLQNVAPFHLFTALFGTVGRSLLCGVGFDVCL